MNTRHLAIAALVLWPSTALAQDDPCFPRDDFSTCIASDNLWPYVGGGPWFSQSPTQTAPASSAAFGFVPVYYRRPIGLRISSADPDGTTIYAVDNVVAATFLIGIGVTDRLQLHMAAPVILFQDGASKSDIVGSDKALPRSAAGDMRFGASFAILMRKELEDGPGLTARFEMSAPTGVAEAFAGYPTATYAPGATFDYRIGGLTLGIDASVRIRDYVQLAGAAIGTQVPLSVGASYDVLGDASLGIGLEAYAFFNVTEQSELVSQGGGQFGADLEPTGEPHIPAEWLLSVRTASLLDGRFRASIAGGSFIPTAEDLPVTTPAMRFALGIHYVYSYGDSEAVSR